MGAVGQDRQLRLVALDAAAVLQRTASPASDQPGRNVRLLRDDADQLDEMPPGVAEVVFVLQRTRVLAEHVAERGAPLVLAEVLLERLLIDPTPTGPIGERVQVRLPPADGDLDDLV
jgi:hypothetical protein